MESVYNCSMVQVYLPMGYPQLSGLEFANVIYQGNVVRLYTVPKDPRTEAQLLERRILSDVSKIRSTLGKWGKAACKTALGSRWSTVIWQAIKADIEGWWSAALEEWDAISPTNKDAWRAACPYQATYNDMGEIYFGLVRVIYHAVTHYSGLAFESAAWTEAQSAAASAWWIKNLDGAFAKGIYDDNANGIHDHGSIGRDDGAPYYGLYGGHQANMTAIGDGHVDFYIIGRFLTIGYTKANGAGIADVRVDGETVATINQFYEGWIPQVEQEIDLGSKGLHYVKYGPNGSGWCNLDFIKVR